ncbi:unnamed protein product [Penicillium salamii]|nr:unnamed protein product [Penicillium salamii]
MVLAVDLLNPTPQAEGRKHKLKTNIPGLDTRLDPETPRYQRHRAEKDRRTNTMGIKKKMNIFYSLISQSRNKWLILDSSQTLVPQPRSFFMDVKCPGCFTITTVFSHAQTVVICAGCSTVLCQPTGGKARLTEGCSFRRK